MPTRLRRIRVNRIDMVDRPANQKAHIMLWKRETTMAQTTPVVHAERTAAATNDLPDSAFAVIEPGGTKDAGGKTTPRSLRHLPYRTASGAIDKPHLRNALARLNQTKVSAELKAKARRKLEAAARQAGVGDYTKGAPMPADAKALAKALKKFQKQHGVSLVSKTTWATDDGTTVDVDIDLGREDEEEHGHEWMEHQQMPGMPSYREKETAAMDYYRVQHNGDKWGDDDDGMPQPMTTAAILAMDDAMVACHRLFDAFERSMESMQYAAPADLPGLLRQTATEFADKLEEMLPEEMKKRAADSLSLLRKAARPLVSVQKRQKRMDTAMKALMDMTGYKMDKLGMGAKRGMGKLGAGLPGGWPTAEPRSMPQTRTAQGVDVPSAGNPPKGKEKKAKKMKKRDVEGIVAQVLKRELGTITERHQAEVTALQKRLEVAEQEAQVEKEARVHQVAAAKVRKYTHIALEPDRHANLIKAVDSKLSEEERTAFYEALGKADAAARMGGLFSEHGLNGSLRSTPDSTGTETKVETMAKRYVEEQHLTREQAIAKVYEDHPELYTDYLDEHGVSSNNGAGR